MENRLNTVLGDKKAENFIGKSTFLRTLDFCFGGDDYLNTGINNVVNFFGNHTMKFTFKFGDRYEQYIRDMLNSGAVTVCDDHYQPVGEMTSASNCGAAYKIQTAENSWRSLTDRYSRIYGKDNYGERKPLKYGEETVEFAIIVFEQLFGVYNLVKEYEDYYRDKNKRKTFRKQATDIVELQQYFTKVDIAKLETIENFHRKMQTILKCEMTDEVSRVEMLIAAVTEKIKKLEDEQLKLGVSTDV